MYTVYSLVVGGIVGDYIVQYGGGPMVGTNITTLLILVYVLTAHKEGTKKVTELGLYRRTFR